MLHLKENQLPYRGDGTNIPVQYIIPPAKLPLFMNGQLLKQWRYVSIWSADIMIGAARASVGLVPQEFWVIWHRGTKTHRERTRIFPVGRVQVENTYLRVCDGDVRIDIELDPSNPLEVMTQEQNAYTWTRKFGDVPAYGTIQIGQDIYPVDARALIDENAGYHRRRTVWYWSGGAGYDIRNRKIAWSVITGLNASETNSERTIWIDGIPQEVQPVSFTNDLTKVIFKDGHALCFHEEAMREHHDNLWLLQSSFRQPFGTFTGTLEGGIQLREAYGVMEYHTALW